MFTCHNYQRSVYHKIELEGKVIWKCFIGHRFVLIFSSKQGNFFFTILLLSALRFLGMERQQYTFQDHYSDLHVLLPLLLKLLWKTSINDLLRAPVLNEYCCSIIQYFVYWVIELCVQLIVLFCMWLKIGTIKLATLHDSFRQSFSVTFY